MGYNDPMPMHPERCECGREPHLLTLGDRPDEFSHHWVVFCECGLNGHVLAAAPLAVFVWSMKHQREQTSEPWLSALREATAQQTQ